MCFNWIHWIQWDWCVSMGLTGIGAFQLDWLDSVGLVCFNGIDWDWCVSIGLTGFTGIGMFQWD